MFIVGSMCFGDLGEGVGRGVNLGVQRCGSWGVVIVCVDVCIVY